MYRYSLVFCLLPILFCAVTVNKSIAQTKEQAESVLNKMTPEEIDKKLKELGISREEAISRAAALNINLEEYLSKTSSNQSSPQNTNVSTLSATPIISPLAPSLIIQSKRIDTLRGIQDTVVPGFAGRIPGNLKPYGYDIFLFPATTFEPVLNVATPPSYALGPGDEVVVSVWGDTKLLYQIQVNREGNLLIPDVGPVSANGMTIQQLREKMLRRMTSVYSSLRNGGRGASSFLDVSLAKLRTIQVFVLGEVRRPGGYSLSSISTALHALYLSGGPSINGTLRAVQIIRNGNVAGTFDFYEYALRADKSKDLRLQDGDIVFVKPVGTRAAVTGFVLRPAVYELRDSENLGDLIQLSGGLRFDAYADRIHIERLVPFDQRNVHEKNYLDFDLRFDKRRELETSRFEMQSGDVVTIFRVGQLPENKVTILGNVKKPGMFELKQGMHIKELILQADSLDRDTFSERGTLFRLLPNLRHEVLSFNPRLALLGDTENNLELKNEDSLMIYKESQFFPEHTVSVGGSVRNPGTYPRHDNMTVADLVVMAGGLKDNASITSWELARLDTTKVGALSRIQKFDVSKNYWEGDSGKPFLLEDFDHLMVPSNPKYNLQRVVEIKGYVLYPGSYALKEEGEKLSSIIKRAGGLRPGAYLEGSTIVRTWNNAGLVPVDFQKILADTESRENISLLDGDVINIAFKQEVVMVRGEVFVPSAVVYKQGESLNYYLEQAGGMKDEADEGRVVVTLPNGRKWEKGWFFFPDPDILGGSIIFVPKKIEKEDKTLPALRDWATIAISTAGIIIGIVQITKK